MGKTHVAPNSVQRHCWASFSTSFLLLQSPFKKVIWEHRKSSVLLLVKLPFYRLLTVANGCVPCSVLFLWDFFFIVSHFGEETSQMLKKESLPPSPLCSNKRIFRSSPSPEEQFAVTIYSSQMPEAYRTKKFFFLERKKYHPNFELAQSTWIWC